MTTILAPHGRTDETRTAPAPGAAWRAAGWFGFVLASIGFGQLALYLYPAGFGSLEWEFGATAQMLGALPLPTIGVAAMLAAALAVGRRGPLVAMTVLLFCLAIGTLALLALFWTVAPIALKQAPAIAAATIRQTVARTTLSGVGFGLLYLAAAVMSTRRLKR